jgi:hypothetical protein
MTTLVIPAAAAAIGWFVGGPTGAQIGWMIGSIASAKDQSIAQPTIGDLRVQTSQYGTAIPYVIGKQRIAGNVIWTGDKTTYQNTSSSGGKGGSAGGTSITTTGYRISMAIALCKGPILGVSRVWADGILIIDARTTASPLVGQLYLGDNTQTADPTMQAALGAGNVPAYRGMAYIVLNNFDLGVTGRIPQFSFEVLKEGGI